MTENPLFSIWTRPRETIRGIVDTNPAYLVVLLACLAGIGEVLDRASIRNMGDRYSLTTILVLAVLLGPPSGLFTLWVSSHLLRWTGGWLGGYGDRDHLKAALAWAYVPVVFALPIWIPSLFLFGSDLFTKETPRLESNPALSYTLLGFSSVEMALAIWTLILSCNTIAEVQGYRSAWKGLLNCILAAAVILGPIALIIITAYLATR